MKKEISRSKELSSLSCDIDSFIDFIVNLQEVLFPEECNFSLTIYLKNNREEKIKFDSLSEFRDNQKLLPPRIQRLDLRLSSYTKNDKGIYSHKSINFDTDRFSGSISADSEDEQWCDYAIHILGRFSIKHRVWYSSIKTNKGYFIFLFYCLGFGFVPTIWLSIFKTSLFSLFGNKNSNTTSLLFLLIHVIFLFLFISISFILPRFTLRTNTQQGWIQKYGNEMMIYGTLLSGVGAIVACIVAIIALFIK